jgi:hypothetical protein
LAGDAKSGLRATVSPLYFHGVFGRFVQAGKAMTPSDAEAFIIFLLYCLAVHAIHLERHESSRVK